MLFSHRHHPAIVRGDLTRTIRRWRRPQARPGGRYHLAAAGSIEVDAITPIDDGDLTEDDATRSGFATLQDLRTALPERDGATLFRIDFHYIGHIEDPRAALAADTTLSPGDLADLTTRLERMDARGDRPWTRQTLAQIEANPGTVSHQLAPAVGLAPARFKTNVRKLKALGLTISLERGYRLSPRGHTILAHLRARD